MSPDTEKGEKLFTNQVMEVSIRLALVFIIVALCFEIIKPFIIIVVWGIIIAVAIFPLYSKLSLALGGRDKLLAALYTLLALSLLIGPSAMITSSLVETSTYLAKGFSDGTLEIPQPTQNVKDWPIIGNKAYTAWYQVSNNLEATLRQNTTQIKKLGEAFISAIAGVGGGLLQFILSVIISGVFLANTKKSYAVSLKIASRLTDQEQGLQFINLATEPYAVLLRVY